MKMLKSLNRVDDIFGYLKNDVEKDSGDERRKNARKLIFRNGAGGISTMTT